MAISREGLEAGSIVPAVLGLGQYPKELQLDAEEKVYLQTAGRLFRDGYYSHALLDVWNAAVCNLRRRVERYSIDLFQSVVKDDTGRKRYNEHGESPSERWSGVDDSVLVSGATKLGLLPKKAGKALEMVNWMRNHATPAHPADEQVTREDVTALVLILERNLFASELPDPGHSVATLFEPVKTSVLDAESIEILKDQIRSLRPADVKVAFGFLLDQLVGGAHPSSSNAKSLLPVVWERASNELKKVVGLRYHSLTVDRDSDDNVDKAVRERVLEFLVSVGGVSYIPDATRAPLYRKAAYALGTAKDSSYGWSEEETASKTLAQLGTEVPQIAFEEVYQEILAVWCGNYWGRSEAYESLNPFLWDLSTGQIRNVLSLFENNERVRSELGQARPREQAVKLIDSLKAKLTIASHIEEANSALRSLPQ